MQIEFEHFYQEKYLVASWKEKTHIASEDDILELRQKWMGALSGWHSPYKAIIDARNLVLSFADNDEDAFESAMKRSFQVLSNLFLKKAVAYGVSSQFASLLPFEIVADEQAAREKLGLARLRTSKVPVGFREAIFIENHFKQHVMELSLIEPSKIDDKEKLQVLKSKIMNVLMQWHSSWSLLIDCKNLDIDESMFEEFRSMTRFLQGFFLKKIVGYSPMQRGKKYPFEVFLARHKAAAQLESEGLFSGEDADCQSRKVRK